MQFFGSFYLDKDKDVIVNLFSDGEQMRFVLETPNYKTGNLIRNLAKVCGLPLETNERGLLVIKGTVPSYMDSENREVFILRLGNTKVANIYPDGRIEKKAEILAIAKTLMSQTKNYGYGVNETIIKSYVLKEARFSTDLHTHMNGNLSPDICIALGIYHQIQYPLYYVKKLGLALSDAQRERVFASRAEVEKRFADSTFVGKYLERKIDDNTFLNFADLICGNIENAGENIEKIRTSLAILKDGQSVFTDLEKLYLYRYVFTKGQESEEKTELRNLSKIPDKDVRDALRQMLLDGANPVYAHNTLFQDKLLWIARSYKKQGVRYAEISDTTLVKRAGAAEMLGQVHEILPHIERETGVELRFLAAIRRIPLNLVRESLTPADYISDNLDVLRKVAVDPYVVGSDFVGEEINDVRELKPVIREILKITNERPDFTIRIHAGENDSLIHNVSHSVDCVKELLGEGQPFPRLRIGHGLYTANLKTEKGKELLEKLREYGVTLEFQITSNVRLNNLNSVVNHPIRKYLAAGIKCVQGSDGGALYGTCSMDEQLVLERFLGLSTEEMVRMKHAEDEIVAVSREAFAKNVSRFAELCGEGDVTAFYRELLAHPERVALNLKTAKKLSSKDILKEHVEEIPTGKKAVVLLGGSFNSENRRTKVDRRGKAMLDRLLAECDPEKVFFVIGNRFAGYERYLAEHNRGFKIFSVVPAEITTAGANRLLGSHVNIRVSEERLPMAIYKSFSQEIFEKCPSVVVAFDGNSAAANVIQDAKNAGCGVRIFVYSKATALKAKAKSLQGYVTIFGSESFDSVLLAIHS